MKTRRINLVRSGEIEVGESFGVTERPAGTDYDQPDGIFISIERDSFGRVLETSPVVHLDAKDIRRLRKTLKRALDAVDPPAPKPEPDAETTWAPATRIETYMQGEVKVIPSIGYRPSQPLLGISIEKNTWDEMSLGPWQIHGSPVIHLTEEQFDALVEAGNRRFGRA